MGLQGMINDLVRRIDRPGTEYGSLRFEELARGDRIAMAQIITAAELYKEADPDVHGRIMDRVRSLGGSRRAPVIGFTGTGGAGKSSLIDEFLVRHLREHRNSRVAVMSSDPSRRRTGGALLGDRIRMNSAADQRVYMRSFATRRSDGELSGSIADAIAIARAAGFDLIVAETAGTGQADAHILGLVDVSVYVMTGEYGAPSQLEKIAMLDYAEIGRASCREKV